jgi:methionine sulfoxide reductase heme-binding subunit
MRRMSPTRWVRWALKPLVFTACLWPLAYLIWGLLTDSLGANPISAITLETGTWTLRFLVITLAITPLRRLSRWSDAIRLRRMLGLFAFFYGTLHFATYIWLDQFFDIPRIVKDVMKRPFITVGFSAFLGMLPLALTSTAGWIRRLGGRNWQRLHRLIYVSALGGVLHYWWLVKADVQRPQIYAALIGLLLLYRLAVAYRRRTPRPVRSTVPAANLTRRGP